VVIASTVIVLGRSARVTAKRWNRITDALPVAGQPFVNYCHAQAIEPLLLPNRRASRRNPGAGAGGGAPGGPGGFGHGGAQVHAALAGGGLLALADGLVAAGRPP
jgi:hypothetical protein